VAYLGDADDVEAAAQWTGEPGELARALLVAGGAGSSGFIDELPDWPGHFECHDLYDHAPEYVRKRFDREEARKAMGLSIREQRAAAGRASGEKRRQMADACRQAEANGEQTAIMWSTDGTTPSPSPSPSPSTDSKESACAPVPLGLVLEPEPPRVKPARKPAAPKPPKPAVPSGPNGYLPEELRPLFWETWKIFPGERATNATQGAKAFAEAVASGLATGPELVGCARRYRASFTRDRLQYMTQAHAWLANAGYMAFLDDERAGKAIPIALGRAGGECLTAEGSGFEDYVMPDYVPPPAAVPGGF
jgi:hypothetical protein